MIIEHSNQPKPQVAKVDVLVSNQIQNLLGYESNNKNLLYLITELQNYNKEVSSSINTHQSIDFKSFKEKIIGSLEKLLIEISDCKSSSIRKERIDNIYNWYIKKKTYYFSISSIKTKSYYEKGEVPDKELTIAENNKEDNEEEVEHRENFNVKGLLNEYKIKKIKIDPRKTIYAYKDNKRKEDTTKELSMNRDSMTTFNLQSSKSTFYSSKNSLSFYAKKTNPNQTFIERHEKEKQKEENKSISPIKEVKSSYSFNRPQYNFHLLNVEKTVMSVKNQMLNDKRTQEEIKHALNEFGNKRALFKGNLNKKNEIKQLVDYYTTKKPHTKKKDEFHPIAPKSLNRFSSSNILVQTNSLAQSQIKRSYSQYMTPLNKTKEKVLTKHPNNVLKRVYIDNDIENEKSYSIPMRLSLSQSREELMKHHRDNYEFPSDMMQMCRVQDPILKIRMEQKELLKVKEIDNYHPGYSVQYNPLSPYDLKNLNQYQSAKNTSPMNGQSKENTLCNTGYNFAKNNFTKLKNDFLSLRKTIGSFHMNEYHNIRRSVDTMRKRNQNMNNNDSISINKSSLLNAFVSPRDEVNYPQCFLPRSGSGLLLKPDDLV